MALTSRLSLTGPPPETPEDFLSSSLGVIFPDDVMNQHGDDDHSLQYTSPHLPRPLHLDLTEPKGDDDRRLFSHFLWNSSLLLGEFVEAGTLGLSEYAGAGSGAERLGLPVSAFDVSSLHTIELGAGTALPSILAALLGAERVVITDYPSPVVLKSLQTNIARNIKPELSPAGLTPAPSVAVEGHSWGELSTPLAIGNQHAFDRVFVADCLWMPWQHANLQRSIAWFLKNDVRARCWVVAGFHTGREKMRGFFDGDSLKGVGLEVERLWERDCDGRERAWEYDRGIEDVTLRKRWLAVGILRRRRGADVDADTAASACGDGRSA
jgi:EEF1A N-terminal glycine/lysine methyltransferase